MIAAQQELISAIRSRNLRAQELRDSARMPGDHLAPLPKPSGVVLFAFRGRTGGNGSERQRAHRLWFDAVAVTAVEVLTTEGLTFDRRTGRCTHDRDSRYLSPGPELWPDDRATLELKIAGLSERAEPCKA